MYFPSPGNLGSLDAAKWASYPKWFYDNIITLADLDSSFDGIIDAYGGSLRSDFIYGMNHPAIYYLALLKYSKPTDLVWDAFAGNGTILNVAKMLGWSNVLATDIDPMYDEIGQADATLWNPGSESVDLIVVQPPVVYKDFTIADYKQLLAESIPNLTDALKPGHVMAYVCCDMPNDGALLPLEYIIDGLIDHNSCRMIGRILCEFYVGTRSSYIKYKAYTNIRSGRFAQTRDTVLFYQKGIIK